MKLYSLVLIAGVLSMLFCLTASTWRALSPTAIAISTHPGNPAGSIPAEEVRAYYLTSLHKTWPGSSISVKAMHRNPTGKEYKFFCARLLHLSSDDVERFAMRSFP